MTFLGAVLVFGQFLVNLEPKTIRAFDEYIRGVDSEMTARAAQPAPLAAKSPGVYPVKTGLEVKHGMIHDWAAVAILPGVSRAKAIAVLEDFTRHSSVYPEVLEGRIEKRDGKQITGFHRLKKKKVFEVNLEARYLLDVLPSPANRYASRTVATEIVELEEPGTKEERRMAPGHDRGFLWRLQTYWTLEETKQGLWMEVRSISLTRDVPMGFGWAVNPIVRDLPRESLEALMDATKKALLAGK